MNTYSQQTSYRISGNIVDVSGNRIYPGTLEIEGDRITHITQDHCEYSTTLLPGFIDAHVHIESSMLVPSEFARLAVRHGTVATVSDPHEIANVLGIEGVDYMINNGKSVPFKFFFGAPSCVPATTFETAGAALGIEDVRVLLQRPEIRYLSEVMNFPGVVNGDPEVMTKIQDAQKCGKKIDGHAPGLQGESLRQYVCAGVTSDHESVTLEEALEKIKLGMQILIREGSAARNFETLIPLIEDHSDQCMFCSDDKHPDQLVTGHINLLVKRALNQGFDLMKVLRCACVNPVRHYGLEVGLLQPGDYADFLVVDNLGSFKILETYVNGQLVAKEGETFFPRVNAKTSNRFSVHKKNAGDFGVKVKSENLQVIEAYEGQIITGRQVMTCTASHDFAIADPSRDLLKIAVVNRYEDALPALGFIKGFGLQTGAIASSVAHDSHNLIAVGCSDEELCEVVNLLIAHRGGLAISARGCQETLPLPVAGLMSNEDGFRVAEQYKRLDCLVKELGSSLKAPFMTLSFMALLVIPRLKISDRGLFDGERFVFTDLFV